MAGALRSSERHVLCCYFNWITVLVIHMFWLLLSLCLQVTSDS
jgi:hypothetical protein